MSEATPEALRGPVLGRLVSLAWPLVLANEISILSYSILLLWVGQLLGSDAVGAVGLWSPASQAILWAFAAVSIGTSVLVSQSVGAEDGRGLRVVAAAMALTAVAWAVVAPLGLAAAPWLSDWLAADSPGLKSLLGDQLWPWFAVALLGFALGEVVVDAAHATGWTRLGLVRVILDLAILAALLPLLIDVAGLGIAGGPLAEGLSALVLTALVVQLIHRRRDTLLLGQWPGLRAAFDLGLWRQLLAIGLPVQATRVALFLVQLFLVGFVARDGEAAVAGYSVAMALVMFASMATMAVAQANAIVTGTAVGARRPERARQSLAAALALTVVLGGLGAALFVGFGDVLAGFFLDDQAAVDAAHRALQPLAVAVFGNGAWQIGLAAMAALGESRRAGLVSLAAESSAIAAAFFWPTDSTLLAACWAFAVSALLKAVVLAVVLHHSFRRRTAASSADA